MTKKIRLMDDGTAVPNEVQEDNSHTNAAASEMTAKQLMKYLEAIDWKLWEMLKIMKADAGEPIETTETEEGN
jgi:hypothetical protein